VKTGCGSRTYQPLAWRCRDATPAPLQITADTDGWCEVEAPPRGYVIYG